MAVKALTNDIEGPAARINEMSSVVSINSDEERLDAATRWILRLDNNDLTEEDQSALVDWLVKDQRNCEVLLEVATTWDKINVLADLSDFFPHSLTSVLKPKTLFDVWWFNPLLFACVVALVVNVTIIISS
jgi:ferric-dicitrate binding protein FerR (iron transport regulator)